MKTIIIFIAGLFLINQAMATCTVAGGSISGGYSEICVGTSTGYMELSGYTGTDLTWQYSTDGGTNWNYEGSSSYQSSGNVLYSTGTYIFRVKVTCYDGTLYTDYSSTKTIEVKNAEGGTISDGGGTLCVGGTPDALLLVDEFSGSLGSIYWEYSTNGGSSYSLDGLGTNTNPYTPYLSALGGAGTYKYRAKVTCGSSAAAYSDNTKTYQVNGTAVAASSNSTYGALRDATARYTVAGHSYTGFLINHTSDDGRLLFLTSSEAVDCLSPTSTQWNSAVFTWHSDGTPVTSTGATVLYTYGKITLLQLNAAPALAALVFLGWDISTTPSNLACIFETTNTAIDKGIVTASSQSTVNLTTNCSTGGFSEGSGTSMLKVSAWAVGEPIALGHGAPLIMNNKKVEGVYYDGNETACNGGPSYFYKLSNANSTMLNFLRSGSETNSATVSIEPCQDDLPPLTGNYTGVFTFTANSTIVSTQNIQPGSSVKYEAGMSITLNDGFNSGSDFIAEIKSCQSRVTTIAAKTDENNISRQDRQENIDAIGNKLKIYPNPNSPNSVAYIEGLSTDEPTKITISDISGKLLLDVMSNTEDIIQQVRLPDLSHGIYFVKISYQNFCSTYKLVIQ